MEPEGFFAPATPAHPRSRGSSNPPAGFECRRYDKTQKPTPDQGQAFVFCGRSEIELEPNQLLLLKNEDYLLKIGNMLDAIEEMEKSADQKKN